LPLNFSDARSCHVKFVRLFCLLILVLHFPPAIWAQTERGAVLTGTVADQSGAVIAGATVTVTNAAGVKKTTVSDDKGIYAFRGLEPGVYNLSVAAAAFKAYQADAINVAAGEPLTIDVSLFPAGTSTEINVEGSNAGAVETETSQVSGTITQKEVVKIGLNGRNFTQLIALAPGVSNQTGQDEAKVGVVGSVKYSVNGGRVEYNTFEVDGSDVLNAGLNGASSTLVVYPSLDAIQEVKVLTSNYGAQYGRTASGTVQVTTKSGAKSFHGNVYEFLRNEDFNARNYFDQSKHAPLYRRNDFGGTIGGPITIPGVYNTKREKTFFFFSEEFRLEKSPIEYNQAVPSLKERGMVTTAQGLQPNIDPNTGLRHFDFTDVCPVTPPGSAQQFSRALYPDCPLSALSGSPTTPYITFPDNNLINPFGGLGGVGSSVDSNALAILNTNLIPLANSATGCNFRVTNLDPSDPNHCYNATLSPSTYWREELFRIDHNVTNRLKATFHYVHDDWDTTVLTPQWGYVRDTFPTVQNRFVGPGRSLVVRLTDAISASLVNDFGVSYSNSTITLSDQNGAGGSFKLPASLQAPCALKSDGTITPSDPNVPSVPQCPIGYLFNNGFGGKVPGIAVLGTNAAYGGQGFVADPSYMPWKHSNPIVSLRDDVSKAMGKHTLQFGGQYILYRRNETNAAVGTATGDLQGLLTFSNLVQSTGNAFADFLYANGGVSGAGQNGNLFLSLSQDYIQSYTQDSAQLRYHQRYQIAEPYFQDDWKVSHRVTVNLGLRLSLFETYREANHQAYNWVASRFSSALAQRIAVDPATGILIDPALSKPGAPVPIPFNPSNFGSANLDPRITNGVEQCGVNGVPAGCMSGHLFNPAPRVGFAWDVMGDGKTSIRGGYGIFFEHGTGNEANTGSLQGSAPLVLTMNQTFPKNYACIGNIGIGTAQDPTGEYCTPGLVGAYPLNVTSVPTKAIWPYAQQWSLSVQRELPSGLVGTFAYVGSKGTHLSIETQRNQLSPVAAAYNPFGPNEPITNLDCQGGGTSVGTIPFALSNGTVVTPNNPAYINLLAACANQQTPNVNTLRPYLGLGNIFALQDVANSVYHAFQTTLRRTRGPLTVGVSYTYSHSIDNSSDRNDNVLVNSLDLRSNRASSNFDERHLFNVSYVYQLPTLRWAATLRDMLWEEEAPDSGTTESTADSNAKAPAPNSNANLHAPSTGSSHWGKTLLDGWEWSGITLFQSGTPFSVVNEAGNTGIGLTDNAGVLGGIGTVASYPDVIPGTLSPGNNAQSFGPLLANPTQFVAPRGLTFGNAGRNFLNNPHRLNFDMALLKHFRISEGRELEFRAEGFNIFNTTQFRIYDPDNPGSSGNNVISCYAGPLYSAGFKGSGSDCVTGASFLHPINAHRPRTIQLGVKLSF
jgi:hypothetical protein